MATKTEAGYSQSLERGLAILSAFRPAKPLVGISELARDIGLSRSTTHRYVATLASLGYLQQDSGTKKYRLGPRVLDLGFSAINSMELREISLPHLQQLSDETGHTVNMAILETNARGAAAGSWWTVQFLIRRCAWHMLDHAWEMEDRDLS